MSLRLATFVVRCVYGWSILFVSADAANYSSPTSTQPEHFRISRPTAQSDLELFMLKLVNADRQKYGVRPVVQNRALGALARSYAEDMCRRDFKGHIDPEGRNPIMRAQAKGINVGVSENIAWCFGRPTAEDMIETCENSMMSEPDKGPHNHRGNILNPNHTDVGIGIAFTRSGEIIIVQEFCDSSP